MSRGATWGLLGLGSGPSELDAKLAKAESKRRKYRATITTLTFRALKAVAIADGDFHETERTCLVLCARTLAVECPDLEALEPISADDLADSVLADEPEKVALLLTLLVHYALVDGDAHPKEYKVVEDYAAAFGVEKHNLNDLRKTVVKDHEKAMQAIKKNASAEAAKRGEVVLFSSGDFMSTLTKLCHR